MGRPLWPPNAPAPPPHGCSPRAEASCSDRLHGTGEGSWVGLSDRSVLEGAQRSTVQGHPRAEQRGSGGHHATAYRAEKPTGTVPNRRWTSWHRGEEALQQLSGGEDAGGCRWGGGPDPGQLLRAPVPVHAPRDPGDDLLKHTFVRGALWGTPTCQTDIRELLQLKRDSGAPHPICEVPPKVLTLAGGGGVRIT